MNRKVTRELPGTTSRIASVLKSKEIRSALAKRASNNELTSRRELEYSALLSQEGLMPEEAFRFGAFETYQAPIKRIEELADLKFSKSVRDADVFGMDEVEEMVTTARYIEINSENDIVLTKARA